MVAAENDDLVALLPSGKALAATLALAILMFGHSTTAVTAAQHR